MKYLFTALMTSLSVVLFAQQYPFSEGFSGVPNGTLPAGWLGDMKVQTYHGMNEDKGLVADIGSTDDADSVITPLIGPLTANTELYFWYQIIDQYIYPSTSTRLRGNGKLAVQISTNGTDFTNVFVIDTSNHLPNLNYIKKQIPVTGYAGQNVYFKFLATFGGGGAYFVDIDSIKVRDAFSLGVNKFVGTQNFSVYPNPVSDILTIESDKIFDAQNISFSNMVGSEVQVYFNTLPKKITANLAALPNGIYFLRIALANSVITRKIIVQH
jgi:hypothetical protein